MLKCSICGKEYETAVERANCEIACDRKKKEEEKQKQKEILMLEKTNRKADIDNTYKLLNEKINAYFKDYGEVPSILYKTDGLTDSFFRLLHI